MSSDAIIVAIFAGIGGIITAGVTAWITLRKARTDSDQAKAEADKLNRNGVLEEWNVIVDRLQANVKEQDIELKALRGEVIKLYAELSALRVQVVERETERIEQRGEIRKLEKGVAELKAPNGGAVEPAPVTVVPATEPLPVKVEQPKPGKS